jgi:hypothetical protein
MRCGDGLRVRRMTHLDEPRICAHPHTRTQAVVRVHARQSGKATPLERRPLERKVQRHAHS